MDARRGGGWWWSPWGWPPIKRATSWRWTALGVTIATLITLGSAPLLASLGERLITRRRTGRGTVAGIGLALAGLVALVGAPTAAGPQVAAGAVFAVGAALGYATVTLAGGRLGTRVGAERITIVAFAGAAALLVPLAAATAGLGIEGDVVVLGALVYLGASMRSRRSLASRWRPKGTATTS